MSRSPRPSSTLQKKGGYSGSKPASQLPPPPRIPSATIRPAATQPTKKA